VRERIWDEKDACGVKSKFRKKKNKGDETADKSSEKFREIRVVGVF